MIYSLESRLIDKCPENLSINVYPGLPGSPLLSGRSLLGNGFEASSISCFCLLRDSPGPGFSRWLLLSRWFELRTLGNYLPEDRCDCT